MIKSGAQIASIKITQFHLKPPSQVNINKSEMNHFLKYWLILWSILIK